eukprot:scaffold1431_cov346-Pavlova_lutheri.AAC.23
MEDGRHGNAPRPHLDLRRWRFRKGTAERHAWTLVAVCGTHPPTWDRRRTTKNGTVDAHAFPNGTPGLCGSIALHLNGDTRQCMTSDSRSIPLTQNHTRKTLLCTRGTTRPFQGKRAMDGNWLYMDQAMDPG